MSELRIYIPKSLAFLRIAKSAVAAATLVDHGTEMNDAHAFALLEFFEFLAPEQITPVMGPGLAAELSAIIESEFARDSLSDRTSLQELLCTHASLFAALFCCDGNEEPKCYRAWLQSKERDAAGSPFDRKACLMANFEVAMAMGRVGETSNPKLQLLKYRIATRTAELLLAAGFQPEITLRQIRRDEVPKPGEILAMQVFVLLKKSPDDLARLCAWDERSCEATFLRWAARDAFVKDVLVAWRWLTPIAYDQMPDPQSECSPLSAAWREGGAAPANLAIRQEPWTETDAEQPFPRLLPKDVKPRFSAVPLMLIGGPGVGKTAFLRALANYLNCAGGQVGESVCLESSDLQELSYLTHGKSDVRSNTSGAAGYDLLVRDTQDPEVARWMRLHFTDYSGEEIAQGTLTPEFLKNLRAARGLLFFVDDRSFLDLSVNAGVPGRTDNDWAATAELAARYARILQRYFDVNKDALHLPVALVVNKADLLLGPTNLLSLNPPSLIPEPTKMELVHTGLRVPGEPADPFERLRSCIHYNLAISQHAQNQKVVFELIERFKGFIAAALCHTFRFQIFLTSSLLPKSRNRDSFSHGVWEVTKWVFNQLDVPYRLQAKESAERACSELEEIRGLLDTALTRDHEAYVSFLKAVEQQKQVMAKVRMNMIGQLLQNRVVHASERMQAALENAGALVDLPTTSDVTEPAPFILRRRSVKESMERLEYQIAYLRGWYEHLSGIHQSVPLRPKARKKEVSLLGDPLSRAQRAS